MKKLEAQQGLLADEPEGIDIGGLLETVARGVKRGGGLLGELVNPAGLQAPTFIHGPERERNFQNWFGDSKVVEEAGKPRKLYHGTAANFNEFKLAGKQQRTPEDALNWFKERIAKNKNIPLHSWRMGTFFTPKPDYASSYADSNRGVVYPVNLKADNPAWYDNVNKTYKLTIPDKTPDALIIHHDGDINEVVVPQPTQIKSIYNRGTYNPEDPDLLGMLRRGARNTIRG